MFARLDFAWILLIATLVSGLIWAIWGLGWRAAHRRQAGGKQENLKVPIVVDYARSFFPVLVLVLVIRSFWFEPFRIPSASMVPTLLEGDFILVNKYRYGLRLPIVNKKIIDIGQPNRGDVVVFRLPSDPRIYYIKRLVGLPGDRVEYRHRRLWINGAPVDFKADGAYSGPGQTDAMLAEETLGEVQHPILQLVNRDRASAEGVFVVPQGYYFMMGDNRDNSRDSRYPEVGFVPEVNLVGKAVRIWMNFSWSSDPKVRWYRIGDRIR